MAMPLVTDDLDRWAPHARALPPIAKVKLSVPFDVFLDEAVEVASALERNWDAIVEDGAVVRPGLVSVAGRGLGKPLHAGLGEDIRSLQRATSDANTNFDLVKKLAGSPRERGDYLLREYRTTLEFLYKHSDNTEFRDQVLALGQAHDSRPSSHPALASALEAYAGLANIHREELDGLGGFSAAFIDEAPSLARELRERTRAPVVQTMESVGAQDLRDRYTALLLERVNAVRASARFVFRDYPQIVREFTSDYERRRRNAARRAGEVVAEPEAEVDSEVEFAPDAEPSRAPKRELVES